MFAGPENTHLLSNGVISNRIKACDDLQQKLLNIQDKGAFFNIGGIVRSRNDTDILNVISNRCRQNGGDERQLIDHMFEKVNSSARMLAEQIANYENFVTRINDLKQSVIILQNINKMLPQGFNHSHYKDGSDSNNIGSSGSHFSYFAGLMNLSEYDRFARMAHRITRGNIFVKNMEVDLEKAPPGLDEFNIRVGTETIDPKTKKPIKKTLVFMLFHGRDNLLSKKVNNLVHAFEMFCMPIPTGKSHLDGMLNEIKEDLQDNYQIYDNTLSEIKSIIKSFFEVMPDTVISKVDEMMIIARREKKMLRAITYLHSCDNEKLSKGQLWIPDRYREQFQSDLKNLVGTVKDYVEPEFRKISDDLIPRKMVKPTFFKLNDFMQPFMDCVEPVGYPDYKEINPALFTSVTFPYLFGVMFGDFGHGGIVLIAAIVLCCMSNSLKKAGGFGEVLAGYRWFALLIGIFSTYNGFIYNDCFALKLPFFESCYESTLDVVSNQYKFTRKPDCMYPFGFDHAWGAADNDIAMTNSFKMKLSIIIAVVHMSWGILLKGWNAIYFRSAINFFFEFLPWFFFFEALFGYMVFMIVIKYFHDYMPAIVAGNGNVAPGIINVFSNIYSEPKFSLFATPYVQWQVQIGCLRKNFFL